MISLFVRVENTVGKGENADLSAFSPFPTVFSKAFFFRVVKSLDFCGKGLNRGNGAQMIWFQRLTKIAMIRRNFLSPGN